MARIRSVKIGFFRNEDLCVFGPFHRLLFEGLWLLADKAGRLEDRPKRIHADLFPFDPTLDIDAMIDELADGPNPFISRYEVEGKKYIAVLNFLRHQRPHHTEPASTIPGQETSDPLNPPEPNGPKPVNSPLDDGDEPDGREGKGKEGNEEGKGVVTLLALRASPADLREAWNTLTSEPIPQCRELTDARKRSAQARLKERVFEEWRAVIGRINTSPFCRGINDRGWLATFDWLLKPDTATKVLEGKYDGRKARQLEALNVQPAIDWFDDCKAKHQNECDSRSQHESRVFSETYRAERAAKGVAS